MLKEFAGFLKTGKTTKEKNYLNDFLILFSIVFFIGILISLLKAYIYDLNMIDEEDFDNLNWETFISYVIVVPFIEEIIFRAPMLVPKGKIYSILISLVSVFSILIYIENETLQASIIILIITLQILYLAYSRMGSEVNNFIKKNYLLLVYLTSISFGLIHMANYEGVGLQTFISVIGRIIAGFYFAFIVTKYDFKSSYFLHGINNVIPFIILFVTK